MKTLLAVLCGDARIDSDGNVSCDTIFRHISVPSFPYQHPRIVLAYSLDVTSDLYLKRLHVRGDLIDEDGNVLDRVIQETIIITGMIGNPNTHSFTLQILNLSFPTAGVYALALIGDDGILAELDLTLRLMG